MKKEEIKKYNQWAKKIKPSEHTEGPWIYAVNPKRKTYDEELGGKWCIISSTKQIDKIWKKVFKYILSGGSTEAKVRTGYSNKLSLMDLMKAMNPEEALNITPKNEDPERVICIYVPDCKDKENIFRIRDELRSLGIKEELKFKTNRATEKRIYTGDEKEFLYIDKIKD